MAAACDLLGHLHHLFAAHHHRLPDRDLLDRFRDGHDRAAFAALVERHGPLVWRVCRRVLRDRHAAEDAFQATFLVLLRKAAALGRHGPLANWLYGVAYRTARHARAEAARRQRREARPPAPPPPGPPDEVGGRELCAVLDAELHRLPDRYRAPLLLCHLEGKTRDEAARQLGWSLGTLKRRLQQGRDLLRSRLARRGLTLSGSSAAAALTTPGAAPAAVVVATVRAASCPAAAPVLALARHTVRALALARLRSAAALLLALALVAAGAGVLARHALPAEDGAAPEKPTPPVAEQGRDAYGDPLPLGALARLGTTRFRHSGSPRALVFSIDDQALISGGEDGAVRFWERATGKELRRLAGHRGEVRALALSADGKTLASAGHDRSICLWDVETGKELRRLDGHGGPVWCLALTPDGKGLVSAGQDRTLRLWDVATGKERRRFEGHQDAVTALALSPDGKALASGGGRAEPLTGPIDKRALPPRPDTSVRLWDVETGKEVGRLGEHANDVASLAFAPDGKVLCALGFAELRLWDVAAGKKLAEFKGAKYQANQSAVFSPDGKALAAVCREEQRGRIEFGVRLWEAATGKELGRFGKSAYAPYGVAFSRDGKTLTLAGSTGAIQLWDLATGQELCAGGHQTGIRSVAFTPDGRHLVSASLDGTARLWEAATGKEVRRFDADDMIRHAALSPDGQALVAGAGSTANTPEPALHVWDVATGKELARLRAHGGAVNAVVFAPDGKTLATAGYDETVRLWDAATRAERAQLAGGGKGIAALAFAPDGTLLAGAGYDKAVRLWDVAAGKEVKQLAGHGDWVLGLAFAPDGKTLASASYDRTVRLWDVATGKQRRVLPVGRGIPSVTFSPDGRLLAAAGGQDRTAHVWDVTTGREALRLVGHQDGVGAVAFAPDGKALATGGHDTTVLIWDLESLKKRPPAAAPSAEERAALWAALAGADADVTYRAAEALIAAPADAVALLKQRLRPAEPPDPERVRRLVAGLDSEQFDVREQATRELEKLGDQALPALRQALGGKPSLELRRRLEALVDRLHEPVPSPETVRVLRALAVLEQVSTPEARQVLEAVAGGGWREQVVKEAKAALGRLAERSAP